MYNAIKIIEGVNRMAAVKKIWQDRYQLYINGEWRDAEGGKTFKVYNPANGEYMAECAAASKADVDDAVRAAWAAFPSWKKVSVAERATILLKIADIIDANKEHLAMIEALDNGKPIRETMNADVPLSSDHFRYFAGVIRAEEGSASMLADDKLSLILNEPIGVVGQIVPWNFPFLMGAWKLAPALGAGNCIIFKPSSTTSLSILEFMKLIEKELPAGVLNIITLERTIHFGSSRHSEAGVHGLDGGGLLGSGGGGEEINSGDARAWREIRQHLFRRLQF